MGGRFEDTYAGSLPETFEFTACDPRRVGIGLLVIIQVVVREFFSLLSGLTEPNSLTLPLISHDDRNLDFALVIAWKVLTPVVDYDPLQLCDITFDQLGTDVEATINLNSNPNLLLRLP